MLLREDIGTDQTMDVAIQWALEAVSVEKMAVLVEMEAVLVQIQAVPFDG